MSLPKESAYPSIQENIIQTWRDFVSNMEIQLNMLEKEIDEAAQMSSICTPEWCKATEHVIDELSNRLFSVNKPLWCSEEDSKKIKRLKHKIYDLYAKYKSTAGK